MMDLIERQAAIDAVHNYWKKRIDTLPTRTTKDGTAYDTKSLDEILEHNKILCNFIKALPAATVENREDEPDHSCEFCYYKRFDARAYPCSLCIFGEERTDMFQPKMKGGAE